MWKSKMNPFGKDCAMHPKVAIQPKEIVEADLGPVIGEEDESLAAQVLEQEIDRATLAEEIESAYEGCEWEPGKLYPVPEGMDVRDYKPSNPKDAIGSNKLPLHLVPSALTIYASLAFLEGALKYGKANWRVAGVRMSIYIDAIDRHLAKLKDGEWADKDTGVPHLSSMLACIGIILDAKLVGKLTDDRPPAAPTADLIAALEVHVPLLKDLFKDHHPHQHTIMDAKEPE